MKNLITKAFLASVLALSFICAQARVPVRVACIGDSITYGSGIEDRDNDSYPAQLQRILGSAYDVRNFGFSARVMVQTGDYPYMKEQMYSDVKAFLPDICVIMLGTNDTKPQNWDKEGYERDYNVMIHELKALPSHPDIFLCYPPTVVTDRWGINEKLVVEGTMPIIDRIALWEWLDVIDTHSATAGMPQNFCQDGVHPNAGGAGVLARTVAESLKRNGWGAEPGLRVMFIGDSITDGHWGLSSRNHYDNNHVLGHGYPEMCAAQCLADHPERNMRFYNRGISGNTMPMMAARWDEDLITIHPDVVSVLIGINDVKEHSVADFDFATWEATYRNLIDRTLERVPGCRFVLITPFASRRQLYGPDPVQDRRHDVVARMTEIVKGIASDYGCIVVDGFSLVDGLYAHSKTEDLHYWLWDGVHPTTAGHRKLADLWLKQTRKIFR